MNEKQEQSIFKREDVISELLDRFRVVPWFEQYVKSLPQDFINRIVDISKSVVDIRVKNDTVIEIELYNPDEMGSNHWKYCFAEPYPGIRILSGNMKGLTKLEGIGSNIKDTATSVIHYCVRGRCEILTKDGMYAFMEPGVCCIESHKHKEKNFNFYGEEYEGVEIAFELNSFTDEQMDYLKTLGVDIRKLKENFKLDKEYLIGHVSPKLKEMELEVNESMTDGTADNLGLFLSICKINHLVESGHITTDRTKYYLTNGQRKICAEIHDYFLEHLSEDITAEKMAEQYNLSHVSLNKYFAIMYGNTLHKYMQNYRMEHAAKLLVNTDMSVAQIALEVGYDNQGKFSSVFKKKYNMTPLEYKRMSSI